MAIKQRAKYWTGRDLLKFLLKLSEKELSLPVTTDGCDCWGDVGSANVGEDGIYLMRMHEKCPESGSPEGWR